MPRRDLGGRALGRDLVAGDTETFEALRPKLLTLAYRMLGDVARAEDAVQDAWLRWQARDEAVEDPRAYLVTVVTRLCLDELDSARTRREESRDDRLPERVRLDDAGLGRVEAMDRRGSGTCAHEPTADVLRLAAASPERGARHATGRCPVFQQERATA